MLIYRKALQRLVQHRDHFGEHRGSGHGLRTDAMQVGEPPLLYLRVDVRLPSSNRVVGAHAGYADLADAAPMIIRGFDVKRDKSERPTGEGRHIGCGGYFSSRVHHAVAGSKKAIALPIESGFFPLTPAKITKSLVDQFCRLVINSGLTPIPRGVCRWCNANHLSLELADCGAVGQDHPHRTAMLGDEGIPQLFGYAPIGRGGRIEALAPHSTSVVHGREIVAEVFRPAPVLLVNAAIECLSRRFGRTKVAQIAQMVD